MTNEKIAVMFPGQGSQIIGMGKDFADSSPELNNIFTAAEEISGYPIRSLCLEGPIEKLTQTAILQPAMTTVNLICWEAVKKAGIKADYFTGHSLGEYSALCASGILSLKETLRLATERGKLMEREAEKTTGGMKAIVGLNFDQVEELVKKHSASGILVAANYNSEKQIVISGEPAPLEAITEEVSEQGGKAIALKVSGAWHSPLVAGAVADFEKVLKTMTFNTPESPVLFNVTAREESAPEEIKKIMASQISSMVRWFEIIQKLKNENVTIFIEVGPKKVLSGLLKKILPRDYSYKCFQVNSLESLDKCIKTIS
jgi:[acyl-carrier-protein] S-malonyltransferase